MFKGSIVALITPFKDGAVDEAKLRELVQFHIENGTSGIVPCGTTGESPTLTPTEHNRVIEIVCEEAKGKLPVMAGTGSNSTAEAIEMTAHAKSVGADGALIVTPYYNKPTQEGLYLHFKAIADAVDVPIILYNIEGRAARNIETSTVKRLWEDCPNIIGVKEASGSMDQVREVREACGDDFIILSGDDAMTLDMMEVGGLGVISVIANIIPQDVIGMINTYNEGNKDEARALHKKMSNLVNSMFIETNPIPVKKAAEILGMCSGELRLPLCDMDPDNLEVVKQAMADYGLGVTA